MLITLNGATEYLPIDQNELDHALARDAAPVVAIAPRPLREITAKAEYRPR